MADGTPDVTLGTLHDDLADLKGAIGGLSEDVRGLRAEMGGVKTEMGGVRVEMGGLRAEMGGLKDEMGGLRVEMGGLRAEMGGLRAEVRDLKATVISGFARMPTREQNDEILESLREVNRRQEAGFATLSGDLRVLQSENHQFLRDLHDDDRHLRRAQHLENQQLLRAVVDGQRVLIEENRALITRIDAIIRRPNNGGPGR